MLPFLRKSFPQVILTLALFIGTLASINGSLIPSSPDHQNELVVRSTKEETSAIKANIRFWSAAVSVMGAVGYQACYAVPIVPIAAACPLAAFVSLAFMAMVQWSRKGPQFPTKDGYYDEFNPILSTKPYDTTPISMMSKVKENNEDLWLLTRHAPWGNTRITHQNHFKGYNTLVANQTLKMVSKRDGSETKYDGGMCVVYHWRDINRVEEGIIGRSDHNAIQHILEEAASKGSFQQTGWFCGNFYTPTHGNGDVGIIGIGNDNCPYIQSPAQIASLFQSCS